MKQNKKIELLLISSTEKQTIHYEMQGKSTNDYKGVNWITGYRYHISHDFIMTNPTTAACR